MLKWFLNHEDQFPLLGVFVGWIFQALVAQNVGAAVRVGYSVQAATFKVRESLALLATQLISLDAVVVYLRNLFVEQRTACSEASQLISSKAGNGRAMSVVNLSLQMLQTSSQSPEVDGSDVFNQDRIKEEPKEVVIGT